MQDISSRTKAYALRIIKLYTSLPKSTEAQVIGKQLIRCGTSVGAHYREGTRSRSEAEFTAKIDLGLQELEESMYWMELLIESGIIKKTLLVALLKEADELISILVTVSKNAKALKV